RIEEHEPSVVHWPRGRGVQLGEQRTPELVGGQNVETLVAHERGRAGDRVECPLDLGPNALLGLAATRPRNRRLGGAGEVEEVGTFGIVELERPRQCLQHALGDPVHVSALQAGVIRSAHAGQHGDLLAAESGHAATAEGAHPRSLRRAPATPSTRRAATPSRSAPSSEQSSWASPTSTPPRSTAPTPTRNSSAAPSKGVATVSCWRRSSASSRTPGVAPECSTAARRTSAPRSKAP